MALPKRKTSKSKKGMRRSHQALKNRTLNECGNCGELRRAHSICPACGHYKGVLFKSASGDGTE
ncbi:MAG: 50S ribosomal protein L32 [Candidatus Poribacteria bacterium]|nr:50S ribosomal protein L32 [Candidatus Poribacteria bacterium]